MNKPIKTGIIFLTIWMIIGLGMGYFMQDSWSNLDCNKADLPKENKDFCIAVTQIAPYTLPITFIVFTSLGVYSYYYTVYIQPKQNTNLQKSKGEQK